MFGVVVKPAAARSSTDDDDEGMNTHDEICIPLFIAHIRLTMDYLIIQMRAA